MRVRPRSRFAYTGSEGISAARLAAQSRKTASRVAVAAR